MKIYCPECENACSDRADACPKCGHPLSARAARTEPTVSLITLKGKPLWVALTIAFGVGIPALTLLMRDEPAHTNAPPTVQIKDVPLFSDEADQQWADAAAALDVTEQLPTGHAQRVWRTATLMASLDYGRSGSARSIPITVPALTAATSGYVIIGPQGTYPFRVEWRLRRDVDDCGSYCNFMRVEQDALYDYELGTRATHEWGTYNGHLFDSDTADESLWLIAFAEQICKYDVHPEFFSDGYKQSEDIDEWISQRSFVVRSREPTPAEDQYHIEIEQRIGDYLFRVEISEFYVGKGSPSCRIMIVFKYLGEREDS